MWTVSAFQQHPRLEIKLLLNHKAVLIIISTFFRTIMICDEDATLDLRVRTVKYFKDLWDVHKKLNVDKNLMDDEN